MTGYIISISNNAKDYSSGHMMYILDPTCQDTVNVSGKLRFALKVHTILWIYMYYNALVRLTPA